MSPCLLRLVRFLLVAMDATVMLRFNFDIILFPYNMLLQSVLKQLEAIEYVYIYITFNVYRHFHSHWHARN